MDDHGEVGRMQRRPAWFTDIVEALQLVIDDSKMDDLDKYKKLVARNMNNWLAHRDQLGKLDLEHEKLTDIPSIVWGLRQNVHSLILKDNLLSSIPLSIADLSALRRLDLTGNDLRQLPQSLAQLVGLQDLFLTSNSFETFPLVVLRLPQLEWLDLQDNLLREIPLAIANMPTLRILDLSDNHIQLIPPEIGELQLTALYLSNNPLSLAPPDNLFTITTLRHLTLKSVGLEQLSPKVGRLVELERLDVAHNRLTAIPEQITRLTRLREASFAYNQIASPIPLGLGWSTSLVSLDIAGKDNVFADLPSNLDRSSTTKLLIVLRNALRKRPDSRARLLDEPDCHLNISLKHETAEDGSSQEVILGATVEKIVQRITAAQLDSKLVNTILMTYKVFMSPKELLDLLLLRFNIPEPEDPSKVSEFRKYQKQVQQKVFLIIAKWAEFHPEDFTDVALRKQLSTFLALVANSPIISTLEPVITPLKQALERIWDGNATAPVMVFNSPPPKPIVPSDFIGKRTLLDIHPRELARQLTLMERALLVAIPPSECLRQQWTGQDRHKNAPNITRFIDHFNHINQIISSTIVQVADKKRRADALQSFIELAENLLDLNNFNGVSEVYSGLTATPVYRLKQTWEMISPKHKQVWERMKQLEANDGNRKNYREALRMAQPPYLLHLGTLLKDLTFIGDGNPDRLKNNPDLINVTKLTMISACIDQLEMAKATPYCLQQVPFIQAMWNEADVLSAEDGYYESLLCEPKPGDNVSQLEREKRLQREREKLSRAQHDAGLSQEQYSLVEQHQKDWSSKLVSLGISSPDAIKKDGYLYLRCDGEWVSYWFSLQFPALYYYAVKSDTQPIGVINLLGVVPVKLSGDKDSMVLISHPRRKACALKGDTEGETRSWLQTLHQAQALGQTHLQANIKQICENVALQV